MSTPAGWYPDPTDSTRTRWWDGAQWTEHYGPAQAGQPAGPAQPTPAAGPAYGTPAYPSAPTWPSSAPAVAAGPSAPGAETNTVWVYLSIVAATLPFFSVFLMDFDGYLRTMVALDSGGTIDEAAAAAAITRWVGGILLITVLSYVALGISVLFAWLDWRELKKRGVARPFHWGWAFFALAISIGVYIIGRTVVLKRETGSGMTALWVWIAATVLGFGTSIAWSLSLVGSISDYIPS